MATRLVWNQIDARINELIELFELENRSQGLGALFLQSYFGATREEIEKSLTDGTKDRGIDYVYIQEDPDAVTIHLLQIKSVKNYDGSSRNFPSNEIDKTLTFVDDFLNLSAEEIERTVNSVLFEKIEEVWEMNQKFPHSTFFEVHFVGNMKSLVNAEYKRIEGGLNKFGKFKFFSHSIDTLSDYLIDHEKPNINKEITVPGKEYFERVDANKRGFIGTLPASELIDLIKDEENPEEVNKLIFDDNVRVYLGKRGRINDAIYKSALGESNDEFWFLNNGLTITCDSYDYTRKNSPTLSLNNVQIVNGGQTSNALFEANKENPESIENVYLLVRIYETEDNSMSMKISESTNLQNPIKTRDLRANDSVQVLLEQDFRNLGYFYERKTNQHKGEERSRRIDAFNAGQAWLAFSIGLPEISYGFGARVYSIYYDQIFTDDTTASMLLPPYLIRTVLEDEKKELRRLMREGNAFNTDNTFLLNATYHIIYTLGKLAHIENIDTEDINELLKQISNAKAIVKKVALSAKKADSDLTYNNFFKSLTSRNSIDAEL